MTVKLTIDCMGGDHGPSVTVPAAVNFARSHPDAELLLVGIESAIRAQLKKLKAQGKKAAFNCRFFVSIAIGALAPIVVPCRAPEIRRTP